jgi:hypothetical protein
MYHKAEQSKLTNSHLCGLKLNESEYSTPSKNGLNSGQMNALPAYAASICSHIFLERHIGPISSRLSYEQTLVVPKVAHTLSRCFINKKPNRLLILFYYLLSCFNLHKME